MSNSREPNITGVPNKRVGGSRREFFLENQYHRFDKQDIPNKDMQEGKTSEKE